MEEEEYIYKVVGRKVVDGVVTETKVVKNDEGEEVLFTVTEALSQSYKLNGEDGGFFWSPKLQEKK